MRRIIAKHPTAILPAIGLAVSLIFAAVALHAHRRAQTLGETGFAVLLGARERFEPVNFDPKPLRRTDAAPVEASMISFPPAELTTRFSRIGISPGARPSFGLDDKPALTIYLAPWSPYCRDELDRVRVMREQLAARGVATRIVLGLDSQDKLDELANELGGDVLFEPNGRTSNPTSGVPAFVVSDASKVVATRVGGFDGALEAAGWVLGRLGR